MLTTEERTIRDDSGNGHDYQITQFPARAGFQIQARLGKALAPLLSGFDITTGDTLTGSEIKIDASRIVSAVLQHIDEAATLKLITDLLANTSRDRREINGGEFDNIYASNYGELARAIVAVIEVNGFFGIGRAGGGLFDLFQRAVSTANSTLVSDPSGESGAAS